MFSASARHLRNFRSCFRVVFVSKFSYKSSPGCGAVSIRSTTPVLIFSSTRPKGSNRQENGPISIVCLRGIFWFLKFNLSDLGAILHVLVVVYSAAREILCQRSSYRSLVIEWLFERRMYGALRSTKLNITWISRLPSFPLHLRNETPMHWNTPGLAWNQGSNSGTYVKHLRQWDSSSTKCCYIPDVNLIILISGVRKAQMRLLSSQKEILVNC